MLPVPGSALRRDDEVAGLERRLSAAMRGLGRVDGHDATSGELKILILTRRPVEVVDRLSLLPEAWELAPLLRAAYRRRADDDVEVLDPAGPLHFRIA